MAGEQLPTIWDKIDASVGVLGLVEQPPGSREPEAAGKGARSAGRRRLRFALADIAGSALWIYAFAKIFIADFDRWVVERVAPGVIWLVDYRAFGFLAIATVILLLLRKRKAWWMVYILAFPLVILFWKLPRFYYRRRNWVLLIGTLHVAWTCFRGLRFGVAVLTLIAASVLSILLVDLPWLLWTASGVLTATWFAALVVAFRDAIAPSSFVRSQRSIMNRVLDSDRFWNFVALEDRVKSAEVERLDREQLNSVMTRASVGLITHRSGLVWAYQLDKYRRSGVSNLFSVISIASLILQAIVTFTFINLALFKLDPSQFVFDAEPGVPTFVYYAFGSIFVSEVSLLTPGGDWASALQVLAGFSAGVLGLLLVVTLFFGIRHARADEAATKAIQQMRRRSDEFARRVAQEFELVSIDELLRRVMSLGAVGLGGIIAYLNAQLSDVQDEEDGEYLSRG